MQKRIGLIVGREWSFPPAFIEEVDRRNESVTAEYLRVGTPEASEIVSYDVILDRFSHEVPYYRSYLRHAATAGVRVLNDPVVLDSMDRFAATSLASRLGISTPRTHLLPHRDYGPEIVHEESLRNLDYPLDWHAAVESVGAPFLLRSADPDSKLSRVIGSVDELLLHYNASGQQLLIIQERIDWDQYARCLVIGEEAMALRFDPGERRYHPDHANLTVELEEQLVSQSLAFARAAGYDLLAIDWAIHSGIPYAVDLIDATPDFDIYALTARNFERVVEKVADMAIRAVWNLEISSERGRQVSGASAPGAEDEISQRIGHDRKT